MCNSSFDAWLYVGGGVQYGKCHELLNDKMPPNIHDFIQYLGWNGGPHDIFSNFMFYYISRAATNIDLRAAAEVLVVNAFLL